MVKDSTTSLRNALDKQHDELIKSRIDVAVLQQEVLNLSEKVGSLGSDLSNIKTWIVRFVISVGAALSIKLIQSILDGSLNISLLS